MDTDLDKLIGKLERGAARTTDSWGDEKYPASLLRQAASELSALREDRDSAVRSLVSKGLQYERAVDFLGTTEARLSVAMGSLKLARQSVENWFAPWGSWKTAWWEGFDSDAHEYSSESFIKAIGRQFAQALASLQPKEPT